MLCILRYLKLQFARDLELKSKAHVSRPFQDEDLLGLASRVPSVRGSCCRQNTHRKETGALIVFVLGGRDFLGSCDVLIGLRRGVEFTNGAERGSPTRLKRFR